MTHKRRKTKETDIEVSVELYGQGECEIATGVGFFDHMLEAFAKHAYLDLRVRCDGDTHIDDHHSVEDVAIVLAQALHEEIYPAYGIERFGNAVVVMDESAVRCDIDLSNRPYFVYDLPVEGKVGTFDVELAEEFFKTIALQLPLTLHLVAERGHNKHHLIESAFKAFAVALRRAVTKNERAGTPSTKGVL